MWGHPTIFYSCWSVRQHSYWEVTCDWIDDISLARHSAALTGRPLKGAHTFDILAAALEKINSEYHSRENVTRTTTDSGSNFLKAFRIFGEGNKEETTYPGQDDEECILDEFFKSLLHCELMKLGPSSEPLLVSRESIILHIPKYMHLQEELLHLSFRDMCSKQSSECGSFWRTSAICLF